MTVLAAYVAPEAGLAPKVRPEKAYVLSAYSGAPEAGRLISEHIVDEVKGALRIGPGRLLDAGSMVTVLESLCADGDGWLQPGVFFRSRTRVAWHVPGKRRPMVFSNGPNAKPLRLEVPYPNLVLVATALSLQVLALADGVPPVPGAAVHHAPLMNLSATGMLCFGNTAVPPLDAHNLQPFEDALFRTRFSHVNHPYTLAGSTKTTNEQHIEMWKLMRGRERCPNSLLRPMKTTLQKAISSS